MSDLISFADISFPQILKEAIEAEFTGLWFTSNHERRKGLIFKKGRLCSIQSNNPEELLGNILLQQGIITRSQNERSLEIASVERRRQGEVLVEKHIVTPKELDDALREQFEQRFLDIFSWTEGSLQQVPKEKLDKAPFITQEEYLLLIERGIMEYLPFAAVISSLSPYAEAKAHRLTDELPANKEFNIPAIFENNIFEILSRDHTLARGALALFCCGHITFTESPNKDTIDNLRLMLKTISVEDPYDALGIDRNISDGGLKRAYIKLVKANHPDTYSYAKDPEVKRLADEVFSRIQKHYTEIRRIREGKPPSSDGGIDDILRAELVFIQATQALKQKDYSKAIDLFKLCAKMNPEEKVFTESYIKTLFLKWQNTGRGNSLEIKSAIKEARSHFPHSDTLMLVLGWVYKKEGSSKAYEAFQTALRINPHNQEARREMRLMEMRDKRKTLH